LFIIYPPLRAGKKDAAYVFFQRYSLLFLLLLFFGFRGFVYNDWITYYPFYANIPTLFNGLDIVIEYLGSSFYEPAFSLYSILCKTISPNYFFFQAVSSSIDIFILYYFFKTHIPHNIIMGFIFFFLFQGLSIEINLLRNAKSLVLFLISIKYINEKNIFLYMGLNIIGMLFHGSAALYLPLYFILGKHFPRIIIIVMYIVGNIILIFSIQWLEGALFRISNLLNIRIFRLILVYLNSSVASRVYEFSVGYFERQFTFILIFLFYNKLIRQSKTNIIFINLFYIYAFIYLYGTEIYVVVERIGLLFVCSYWILYAEVYRLISGKNKKMFLFLLIFYGALKLMSGHRFANQKYENVLFGINDSYYERQRMHIKTMKEWEKTLNL
jgi:hypothetical protein